MEKPNRFIELLACTCKQDIERIGKKVTIDSEEFTDTIIACKAGLLPFNHTMHFYDYVPEDVETREEDWQVLHWSKEEIKTKKAQKALRRIFKDHGLRKYQVGHMFFSRIPKDPITHWHFVHFDLKELEDDMNHWTHGSHIHLVNHLWPNLTCQGVWDDFIKSRKFPKNHLHIRYKDA